MEVMFLLHLNPPSISQMTEAMKQVLLFKSILWHYTKYFIFIYITFCFFSWAEKYLL